MLTENISLSSDFIKVSLISTSSFIAFVFISKIDRSSPTFLYSYTISAIGYVLLFMILERSKFSMTSNDRKYFWIITILLRLLVLIFPIALSDDIFRYIWDAQVQRNGINPYLYAPNADELMAYRPSWWHLINQPNIPTPYPPFSQILFYMLLSNNLELDTKIMLFRVVMIFIDLGVISVLQRILHILEKPDRYILYYSWSPLVLMEIAGNGHNDVVATFFMLISIYYHLKQKNTRDRSLSAFFLSIAVLTKIFPIILFAFYIPKWRTRELFSFTIPLFLFSIPYLGKGINPLFSPGQQIFVRYFEFNQGIFRIFQLVSDNFKDPVLAARLIYLIIFIIVALAILTRYYLLIYQHKTTNINLIDSAVYLYFSALLLAPDIQPWYILWVFSLGIISRHIPVIVHSITVVLSYEIYIDYDRYGIWQEKTIILVMEYIPILITYFYLYIKKRSKIQLTQVL